MHQLTLKQRIFLREYISSRGNATKAAMVAYDIRSRNTAGVVGFENLRKPKIVKIVKQIIGDNHLSDSFISFRLRSVTENTDTAKEMLDAIDLYLRLTGR
ncbi:terminase small subunit [Candidatus Collierbacteria bacterium]|nr:terminase small subunit [Candidatus Collierbacteria bacterium]